MKALIAMVVALGMVGCVDGDEGAGAGPDAGYECQDACKDYGWICEPSGDCQCNWADDSIAPLPCHATCD